MKKNLIFSLCTVFCVITFTGCGTIKPYKKTVKSTPPGAGMTAAEAIAKMVTDNSAKLPNKSVAVVEFCDINGNANMFGSLLSERVTVITVQTSDIKVVERNLVKKILDEQKLSAFGLTESSNAKK